MGESGVATSGQVRRTEKKNKNRNRSPSITKPSKRGFQQRDHAKKGKRQLAVECAAEPGVNRVNAAVFQKIDDKKNKNQRPGKKGRNAGKGRNWARWDPA